jgi:hypothetical protein
MAPGPLGANQRSPQGVLGRKTLALDQARALVGFAPAGDLGRERQEELVQALLREEVAD